MQRPRSPDTTPAVEVEVAVIGGGLVGAAAALGAARTGRSVALIDPAAPLATDWLPPRLGHDLRNVALGPAAQGLLEALGVWSNLAATPYRAMRVRDARGTAMLGFDAAELKRPCLGWMLENGPTLRTLWQALSAAGVTLVDSAVGAVEPGPEAVRLDLGDGMVSARLVLAADGANSRVRAALAVAATRYPTGHAALVTVVETSKPHAGVAHQVFEPEGPVALLPTATPNRVSVVWSQPPEEAERRRQMDVAGFAKELGAATQSCLGDIRDSDVRVAFPLEQLLVTGTHPHARVLIMGDAAHVLHPLAGLGANLGLDDVRLLLHRLSALPPGADPGAMGLWDAFARRREAQAARMVALMAGLKTLYAAAGPWPQWARNAGVRALGQFGPLRRTLMREAMGIGPLGAR
ncbi:MAG: FAD-dependent monooxygenase [Pseudomonadales bacterium]